MPNALDIAPEDIVAEGRQRGKTPQEIAAKVRQWRDDALNQGAAKWAGQDPEHYAAGVTKLDTHAGAVLGSLRGEAEQQWARGTFKTPEELDTFSQAWESGPEMSGSFDEQKQQLMDLRRDPTWTLPAQKQEWETLNDAKGSKLGRMQVIDRGGEQDVLLNYIDQWSDAPLEKPHVYKTARLVVPKVKDEEISAAASAAEQRAKAARDEALKWKEFSASSTDPESLRSFDAQRQASEQAAKNELLRAEALRNPEAGRALLMQERTLEALKQSPAYAAVSKRNLGEDFVRGAQRAMLNLKVAVNDATGDTAERDKARYDLAHLREALPGSTGRNTEGVRGFISDAAEGAGGMTPQIAAMAAGGVPGVSMRALGAASMTQMGGSAYGAGIDETLTRADQIDADADKLADVDPVSAQQLREQAAGLREGYRGTAAVKAGVEMASEMILPEHKLLTGGASSALRRVGEATGKSMLEGAAAEIGNQAVNAAVFGDPIDLEQIARGAALEAAAGSPMIAASALPRRTLANDRLPPNQTPAQAGPPEAPEAPEAPGATPATAPLGGAAAADAPLSMLDIAARAGRVNAPIPRRQAILAGVPDRVPGATSQVSSSQTLPATANPDPAPTFTGSNEQMGSEMPVPPPTANAGAGAGAVGIELMTPDQLFEIGAALDVEQAERRWNAARAANNPSEGGLASMDRVAAKAGAGPNAQRIEQERMQAVSLAVRQGLPVHASAMENWAQYPTSNGFDASGNIPRRGIPAGYEKQGDVYAATQPANPTANVLGAMASEPPQTTANNSQPSPAAPAAPGPLDLLRTLNDTLPETARAKWTPAVYAAAESYFQSGDETALAGVSAIQRKRIVNARIDADPELLKQQQMADRKGEHKINSQEKRDRAFEEKTTFKEGERFQFSQAQEMLARAAEIASGRQRAAVSPALASMISAPTPGARSAVRTPENGEARGVQRFFQPSPTTANNSQPLQTAYQQAVRGSSTQMAPLSSVYAQARLLDRTLTVDQFLTQVQDGYNNGTLYLEGAGSQQEAAQASLSLPGTNVGTAIRMMPVPQYSRQGIAPAVAQKAAADAVKLLAERLPHLTGGKLRTYADAAAFLADAGYHRGTSFTSAELAALEGAEAFYDNLTGSTVVLLNQIGLREGETPIRAVARVLLHERVGHEGVNALLKDSTEAAKWDKLAARIPQAELDGIATEPGYTHLAGDRGQLALEWLARQTERIEGARNAAAIEGGLSGVAKQLWQALKELLGKVFANFSRPAALASEVAEIITRARAAQMAGTALPMTADAMATRLQMSMNPLHRAGTPFEVSPKRLALRAILTGSPLPRALKEVVMSTDNERKALDASFARIGDLMRVAAEGVAARTGTPLADVYAQVNAYLEGQPGAQAVLMNVDEGLAEASRRARNMLDDMTQAIANTLPNSDLRATMIGNMGSWMRRGYAAFDEASGWNFKGVLAAARAGKQLGGKDAARIMREAAAFLEAQDTTLQGQRDASGLPIEGTLLHAEMKDLMDREVWAAAMLGGAGVRKNTSSLMRRKDIPGQLRALMGEETNPLRKYAASGAFQAQFLARHQGQIAMRQIGLAQGLFQTQRGGDFNTQIPVDVKWSGMAGLWTTPELWAALQATSGTDLMGAGAGGMLLQGLYWLSNMAKLNRVALNPKSWVPNIYGGLVSLVQSGDVLDWHFMRRVGDAMRTMQAGNAKASDVRDAAAVGLKDAQRSLLARLQAGGVINSNVMLRDIAASLPQSLMNFIERTDYGDKARGAARGALLGNALARSTGGPLSVARGVGIAAGAVGGAIAGEQRIQNVEQKIADFVLSGPDNLVKITGWLRNYEVALSAGMNAQQAEAQATERTLNTFPNYARLPALAREASRLGVIGSFVAFQVEVLRNYGHNWLLASRDLRSGNAALQADAMRRMIGLSSVTALAFGGLSGALTLLLGSTPPDDERNKKWRKWFAAPWEKDALLHFNSYDENGVSYFNPSYLVPQTTMAELVETLNQGLPPEEAAQRFLGRLWEQYGVGSSVHVSPLLAALTNQNRAGRPITYREGVAGAVERADYAAKVIADPGAVSLLTELVYALQSKEVDGKTYTTEQLAKQLAGMRVQTQTWDHLLEMRYKGFSADYQNVRAEARRQIKAATSTPAQAMQWANTEITRLQSEVKAFEADLPQMNIPAPKAKTARKSSRIGTLSPVELTKDGKGLQAD